jgi:hypothetical protein
VITNTRLTELHRVANQCQKMVDMKQATILEQDFVDLYTLARDHMIVRGASPFNDRMDNSSAIPHVPLLFGR